MGQCRGAAGGSLKWLLCLGLSCSLTLLLSALDSEHDLNEATSALYRKLERLPLKCFKPSTVLKKVEWALFKRI